MTDDIHVQLTKYLADAHSIEEQALAQLRTAPDLAGNPQLAENYREHLRETEVHESRARALLETRAAKPSTTKDVVMKPGGKGFLLFAKLNPDTPGKLHAHSTSYEGLELASYELLAEVAERAGEPDVAEAARAIRDEERAMLERLEGTYDAAVEASLAAVAATTCRSSCASTWPTRTRSRSRRSSCSRRGRRSPATPSWRASTRSTSPRRA